MLACSRALQIQEIAHQDRATTTYRTLEARDSDEQDAKRLVPVARSRWSLRWRIDLQDHAFEDAISHPNTHGPNLEEQQTGQAVDPPR